MPKLLLAVVVMLFCVRLLRKLFCRLMPWLVAVPDVLITFLSNMLPLFVVAVTKLMPSLPVVPEVFMVLPVMLLVELLDKAMP